VEATKAQGMNNKQVLHRFRVIQKTGSAFVPILHLQRVIKIKREEKKKITRLFLFI